MESRMQIEIKKISELRPYEKNARTHPQKQIDLLAENIKRFGFTTPVLIDESDLVIAGHGRMLAMQKLGRDEVPCVRIAGLTEEEVKALRLADNQIAQMGDWDMNLVIEELKTLSDTMIDLTGFDKDLIIEPDDKDDVVPSVPDEPQSEFGDLYEIGPHRVMCGDSTKAECVERLMGGAKADMVFTDPPYGMNLKPKKNYASKKRAVASEEYEPIIGDQEKFDAACIFAIPAPVYYIWGADYFPDTIPMWDEGNIIVWAKRMNEEESDKVFGSVFEICWTYPKQKKVLWFERAINQSSEALGEHPTQKPTGLAVRAIEKSAPEGGLLVDLFLGSGSTLIAAEKTGRTCYGMELDPKYVDVIISRYLAYTGKMEVIKNGVPIVWQK